MTKRGEAGGRGGPTAETLARAQVVADWLTAGHGTTDIYGLARESWGVAPRSADRLIAAARELLIASWNLERPALLAQLLTQTQAVYKAAMASGNFNAAQGALALLARLAKLT